MGGIGGIGGVAMCSDDVAGCMTTGGMGCVTGGMGGKCVVQCGMCGMGTGTNRMTGTGRRAEQFHVRGVGVLHSGVCVMSAMGIGALGYRASDVVEEGGVVGGCTSMWECGMDRASAVDMGGTGGMGDG